MFKVTLSQKNSNDSFTYRDELSFSFETMEAVSYFCEAAMTHGDKPVDVSIEMLSSEEKKEEE